MTRAVLLCPAVTLLASVLAAASACGQQGEAEIILAERPGQLVLLDRYQRNVTAEGRKRIIPFTPMVVREGRLRLGDGLTPARKVEIEGEMFYLVEDGSGGISGLGRAGIVRTLTGTILPHDTVEILARGAVRFLSPLRDRPTVLTRGDRVVRYFAQNTLTYARRVGRPGGFGWLPLPPEGEKRIWTALGRMQDAEAATIPRSVEDAVHDRLRAANDALQSLFAHFSKETGQDRTVPVWSVRRDGEVITCDLRGHTPLSDFAESTTLLARDLEAVLLGSSLTVASVPGRIEIRQVVRASQDH